MKKIWLIARMTYLQRVRSGAFLILTFALPVLMVVAGAIPFLLNLPGKELPVVGYVDQTRELAPLTEVQVDEAKLMLRAYPDETSAAAAMQAGTIGAYLTIPADYFSGGQARYTGPESPNERLQLGLERFLRQAQMADAAEWQVERAEDPGRYTYVALSSGQRVEQGLPLVVRFAAPAILALSFGLAVTFTAGQMGQAVAEEKENRAMEMVITSLRPSELVAGKILGLSLLTLTQFAVWGLAAGAAALLALYGSFSLQDVALPWSTLGWGILLIVPGYFLFAVLAAGLGIIAGDAQQAQQLAGLLGALGLAPLWFVAVLFTQPDGPLSLFLSFFPLTSPSWMLLRAVFSGAPVWQFALAVGISLLSLAASLWAVARLFRTAMLLYGSSLNPRQIWQALRSA
ncbi:MAG TPA: ABC transporter permease [Anaerolineales bacterium]|nr:ABC transporter permease [Anaerolineales bacterium]